MLTAVRRGALRLSSTPPPLRSIPPYPVTAPPLYLRFHSTHNHSSCRHQHYPACPPHCFPSLLHPSPLPPWTRHPRVHPAGVVAWLFGAPRVVSSSSSLGTADVAEEDKAGVRHHQDSPTGSLGVRGSEELLAGERKKPSGDAIEELKKKEGSAAMSKEDLERKEKEREKAGSSTSSPSTPPPPFSSPQPPPAALATATAPASPSSPVPPTPPSPSSSASASSSSPTTSASSSPSLPSHSPPTSAPASLASPALTNKNAPAFLVLPPVSPDSPLIRGVLWLDCVYPMQVHWLDPRHLLATHNHELLVPTLMPSDVEILSMIPRIKEGGVFVQFETRRGDAYSSAEEVAQAVIRRLRKKPVRARFTTRPVHCHLVKGDPFLEDLLSRFPAARLRIEVKGNAVATSELTLEHLFGELRAFGRINDLVLGPYLKEQPRQASVQFRKMHGAVGARNCLHRYNIPILPTPPTSPLSAPSLATMFLTYDSVLKTSYIVDFFQKHPRIMVPLLGLLFAAFTFLIFDPLRSFNIVNKITGRFTIHGIGQSGPLAWLRSVLSSVFSHRIFDLFKHEGNGTVVRSSWSAREADEEKVVKWLTSIPDRLLFITGAKGAGKQALVKKVCSERRNVVTLNFAAFIERNDEEFVKGLSAALGFTPGFSLLTWVSSLMDIFTPGAGKASGAGTAQFSSQLQKILECTTDALVAIDSKQSRKVKSNDVGQVVVEEHKDRGEEIRNRLMELTKAGEATTQPNQHKLTSGKQIERNKLDIVGKAEADGQQSKDSNADSKDNGLINTDVISAKVEESKGHDRSEYADSIPLFIVDGFSPDNKDKHNNFMAAFVQFAAQMTSAQLGRFLFLTDSTLEENISKSMPDIKVQEVSLSDADTDSALEFVLNSVSASVKEQMSTELKDETMEAVSILGGRYSDLLSLVRQLESGASPMEAAEEIVNQSIGIVKSLMFSDGKDTRWNRTQLWQTLSMLVDVHARSKARGEDGLSSEKGMQKRTPRDWVGYDDCLFNIFQGDDLALRGLVRADLLRIESRLNEQDRLRAGSPVLLEAFCRLRGTAKFGAGMDILVAKAMVEKEQKKIAEVEDEISKVGRLEADFISKEKEAASSGMWEKTRAKSWWGESPAERTRREFVEEMADRRQYLLSLLHDSHAKVAKYDQQRREAERLVKNIQL